MRRPLIPFALLALGACGPEPTPVAPPPAPPPAPLAVDDDPAAAARLGADVTFLASPELAGRGTGDAGGKAAADHVVKRFQELRLVPFGTKAELGPADYRQAFQARVGAKVTAADVEVARDTGKGLGARLGPLLGVAVGSASGEARGKGVFVGHGITAAAAGWDDYAAADVSDAIAVVLDGVPPAQKDKLRDFGAARYKLRTAREHKAKGVVIIAASDALPPPPEDVSHMGLPAVVVARSYAAKLFPKLHLDRPPTWEPAKAGKAVPLDKREEVRVRAALEPVEATSWNLVGMLPARADSKTRDEVVIVGAHYDHLGMGNGSSRAPGVRAAHPGADDNASGTALMLEVARRLASLPRPLERNVLFMAFGAEEIGAVGSRHWVAHPTVPLERVVGMLNADMVGRMEKDHVVVDGVSTSTGWRPIIEAANRGLGLDLALGGEGFGASDHASFTAVRVPVTFFFTGVHPDYHMPSDTADKINTAGEARIATLVGRMALALAQQEGRLAFVDPPADPHKGGGRGGFKVSLGTIPDYAYTGRGLKLDGVRAEAPAARAGLQRGDVIVKVGSHEIGNIHDYMFALGELEAGRKVTIEVEREGKRVPLEVVPAPGK